MYLLPASVFDVNEIHQLAYKIWTVHYPPIIGNEQVEYMLKRMYAKETLHHQISEGKQIYFLLQNEKTTIGFLSIEVNNTEAFINKFYILNNQQRNGLGKQAFDELINYFEEVKTIRLQVNRQNFKAINFYFKLGFVIEKVADFEIGAGYQMNDFIMIWKRN
jgi:ribosomal protein S18 acetylase RimI-like enzyme